MGTSRARIVGIPVVREPGIRQPGRMVELWPTMLAGEVWWHAASIPALGRAYGERQTRQGRAREYCRIYYYVPSTPHKTPHTQYATHPTPSTQHTQHTKHTHTQPTPNTQHTQHTPSHAAVYVCTNTASQLPHKCRSPCTLPCLLSRRIGRSKYI